MPMYPGIMPLRQMSHLRYPVWRLFLGTGTLSSLYQQKQEETDLTEYMLHCS